MIPRRTSVVSDLALRLVVPGGSPLPVAASVRYETHDPYAVHVAFHTGGEGEQAVVEWTFARQLLTDGLVGPTGAGDVKVWPSYDGACNLVNLSLSSPSGSALFEVPLDALVEFLTATYSEVPLGMESDYVDLDAELALLLWSDS